ncbi:MAG: rane fusion protein multidrug efflux system [Thermoanaerobaculia bacterium]|jgi:membrane fusion protein (multidrug efflux system)|nr:rane fusion protein multidrug efflux system [Thermoanaerobaculia bacterium]
MAKRMILMLVVVIAFVAILGVYKYSQIKKAMSQGYTPPPEAVTTIVAKPDQWDTTISAIGTVAAVNGVTLSADLPGVVEQISFDSGRTVGKGDVLVRLDTMQERAQLASAEAQRELTRVQLQRSQKLQAAGIAPKETLDRAGADFKQAEAAIEEIRATIERKTIRAPFAGILGLRQINDGQSLASGAPIVSLQSLQPVYVNFSVPQQQAGLLQKGGAISVTSDAFQGPETGRINAFDSVVNEETRNIQVQSVFTNDSHKLRPGMYVEAQLAQGARMPVIALPVSAISYAPFGDSVFIVEDVKGPDGKTYRGVRQQFVKLGGARGDLVAVLTGVKPGEEIVSSGIFKLRPGAAVTVNNAIQPGASATPKVGNS